MRKKEPLVPVLILGLLAFTVLFAAVVYRRRCADGVGRIDSRPGAGPVGHSRRRVCGVDDPAFLADAPTAGGAAAGHPAVFSAFWNTCLLAFAQIAGQLVVAAPASWAFAKLRFAGRRFLLLGYIALMVLPFQVLMVPNYLIATHTPWNLRYAAVRHPARGVFGVPGFYHDPQLSGCSQ